MFNFGSISGRTIAYLLPNEVGRSTLSEVKNSAGTGSALSEAMEHGHSEPSGSTSEKPSTSDVFKMVQELDANWTKKFESLDGLLKRALSDAKHETEEDGAKRKKARKETSDEDNVLVVNDEDTNLDQLEDDLLDRSQDDSSDDELLETIASELNDEEKLGEKVRERLAGIVNGRFKSKLAADVQKSKFEAYNRPENCPQLVVPSVNPEIWSKLPQEAIKTDLKLQHIQRSVIKAATASTRAAELLLGPLAAILKRCAKHGPITQEDYGKQLDAAVRGCTDSIALCGHASREISLRRRMRIKPHLNKQFARICDESTPITSHLFGDNLPATLKEVKDTDRISASFAHSEKKQPFRFQGNRAHMGQPDSGRRGAFLGRGRNAYNRRHHWGNPKRGNYRGPQNPNLQ